RLIAENDLAECPMRLSSLLFSAALITAFAVSPGPAGAAMLGDAAVAYRADSLITVNGRSYGGKVFHRPGQQRHEEQVAGIPEVVIIDAAEARGWLVVPGLRSFVQFALPPIMTAIDDTALRRSPVGHDSVSGVATSKYPIDRVARDGTEARGFVWVSRDGVLMRIDGTVTRRGASRPVTVHMELSNVEFGSQDAALFAVPAGLTELPRAALEPLLGGGPSH